MYRNEEASGDPLINKLERESLPSFSTIVGTGDRILECSLFLVGSLNWVFFWDPKLCKRTVR